MGKKITPEVIFRDDAKGRNLQVRIYKDDTGEVRWIKPEIIDNDFASYMHWAALYCRGQVTKETAMMILEADHLMKFYRDDEWVIAADGISSADMDKRYADTSKREQIWNVIMGKRNSPAFTAMLNDYIGNVIKVL